MMTLLRGKAAFDGGVHLLEATSDQITEAFFGESPRAYVLVAEQSGTLVGMATYFPIFSTFLAQSGIWLADLYVDPDFRCEGIGEQLMTALAHVAKSKGAARIDWTVARANERGQAFYRSLGATIRTTVRTARLDQTAIRQLAARHPPPGD